MNFREIRQKFLDYFKSHGHEIVESSSLVPLDDPSLLFINSGMAPFKRLFLGEEKRGYTRATDSQKCVRAGGNTMILKMWATRPGTIPSLKCLGIFPSGITSRKRP